MGQLLGYEPKDELGFEPGVVDFFAETHNLKSCVAPTTDDDDFVCFDVLTWICFMGLIDFVVHPSINVISIDVYIISIVSFAFVVVRPQQIIT